MRFCLNIDCGNAAFHEAGGEATDEARGAELAAILRRVAERVEDAAPRGDSGRALDSNGNTVGTWYVTGEGR